MNLRRLLRPFGPLRTLAAALVAAIVLFSAFILWVIAAQIAHHHFAPPVSPPLFRTTSGILVVTLGLVIAGILALIAGVLVQQTPAERRRARRDAKINAGLCPRCGYNIHSLDRPRCPECGEPL